MLPSFARLRVVLYHRADICIAAADAAPVPTNVIGTRSGTPSIYLTSLGVDQPERSLPHRQKCVASVAQGMLRSRNTMALTLTHTGPNGAHLPAHTNSVSHIAR